MVRLVRNRVVLGQKSFGLAHGSYVEAKVLRRTFSYVMAEVDMYIPLYSHFWRLRCTNNIHGCEFLYLLWRGPDHVETFGKFFSKGFENVLAGGALSLDPSSSTVYEVVDTPSSDECTRRSVVNSSGVDETRQECDDEISSLDRSHRPVSGCVCSSLFSKLQFPHLFPIFCSFFSSALRPGLSADGSGMAHL